MKKLFDLSDRVALVVGGGGYLGGAVCDALAAHGAHVIVADINHDAVQAGAQRLTTAGGSAEGCVIDAGDEASIQRVFAGIQSLDLLVNMAASSRGKPLETVTVEEWDYGLRITLTAAMLLAREAIGRMPRRGGSIVHFSSMYGMVSPDPGMYEDVYAPNPPDYGAAKAGMLQLTRYQAVFWAKRNVRVNAVCPGPFPKPYGQGGNGTFVERLSERVPLGRVGRAEEIAGAVVYLGSDAASFVTGTSLVVDGGWTAW